MSRMKKMNQFERDLRETLRRREAPEGFAEKVLARTRESERSPVSSWRWLAVVATVVLLIGGGFLVQEQRRRSEEERNKQQLIVALEITSSKLNRVQARLDAIQKRTLELHLQQ